MIGPIFGRATLNNGKVRNTKQAIHNGHMKLIVIRYCLLNDMKKMSSKWYENYTRFINNIYIRILYINIIIYVHYFSFFSGKVNTWRHFIRHACVFICDTCLIGWSQTNADLERGLIAALYSVDLPSLWTWEVGIPYLFSSWRSL